MTRRVWIAPALAAAAVGLATLGASTGGATSRIPQLQVKVTPRSVLVDRRTTFRFRVRTEAGSPVAGATVRFAGKRATTGDQGRARIVTSLGHAGRWRAKAAKPGYDTGRARVSAHRAKRPLRFDGTCDMDGTVSFKPRLTNAAQQIKQTADASGTCSGTLVDRRGRSHELEEAAGRYLATGRGEASCGSGSPTGSGVLVFAKYGRLRFTLAESRAGGVAIVQLRGRREGSAVVTAAVSPEENPADVLLRCSGDGLAEVGLSGHLATSEPISG
jgi:hypothetical protein